MIKIFKKNKQNIDVFIFFFVVLIKILFLKIFLLETFSVDYFF